MFQPGKARTLSQRGISKRGFRIPELLLSIITQTCISTVHVVHVHINGYTNLCTSEDPWIVSAVRARSYSARRPYGRTKVLHAYGGDPCQELMAVKGRNIPEHKGTSPGSLTRRIPVCEISVIDAGCTMFKGLLVGASKPVIAGAAQTKDLLPCVFTSTAYAGGVIL